MMTEMTCEFWDERTIDFVDTDTAGIVHFSNYFRFMEAAEHAFFHSLGLTIHDHNDKGGMYGWARVHVECDYTRPLHFRDTLRIHLLVSGKTKSTLSYEFTFHGRAAISQANAEFEPLGSGRFTVAHVGRDIATDPMRARRMPDAVATKITVAPPERLNDTN